MKGLKWIVCEPSDLFPKVPQTQALRAGIKGDALQTNLEPVE